MESKKITDYKDAVKKLEESVDELTDFKFALDASSIVAITDQRGRITYVNDEFCRISQYTRNELIGENHRIINSGIHSIEFFRTLWRTIANGNVWKGAIRNQARDGSYNCVDKPLVTFLNYIVKQFLYFA